MIPQRLGPGSDLRPRGGGVWGWTYDLDVQNRIKFAMEEYLYHYLGRQYRLKVIESDGAAPKESVKRDRAYIYAHVRDKTDTQRIKTTRSPAICWPVERWSVSFSSACTVSLVVIK